MPRKLSLAGQFLVLQLCIVLLVVAAVAGISIVQSTASFRETEGRRLLSVAETVAANDAVRLGLVDPQAEGALLSIAEGARGVSGASTVLIADRFGVLRTGPDINRPLNLTGSTVAQGRSWVGEIDGQLVAQVPVLDANGVTVGMVSAGRRYPTLAERFGAALPNLLAYLVLGCVLGAVGSWLLARRVNRQTLGLDAHEIVGLAEHREAMLHGIKEGVIALDPPGRVTLANDEAIRLLNLPSNVVGQSLEALGLSRKLRSVLTGRSTGVDLVVLHGDRVLVLNHTPIGLRGNSLGSVTTLRDRTELVAMQHELDVTRYATDAMYSQARAFAARMRAIVQLLTNRRYEEASREAGQASRAYDRLSRDLTGHIADAGVAAVLVAKGSLAAADGVDLHLANGSSLPRLDGAASVDVVAVLAAMIDHSLAGLAGAPPGESWLEVSVQFGGNAVHLAVRDSAPVLALSTAGPSGVPAGAPSDRLGTAQAICARRGGHVGWDQGDHPVLEAWLPAGSGAL